MSSLLVGWSLIVLLASVPPTAQEPDAELKRHQGTWDVVKFVRNGEDSPADLVASIVRIVDGDHVVWRRDGKSFSGSTIVLDPTADPKTIDILADGGPARDKRVRGVYKLEDDKLTICTSDPDEPRPKDFKAEKGSKQTLMVFKREPKKTP